MAKRAAAKPKAKKNELEQPSYRMIIENGRLVPATPIDQEKLMTWRNGTKVLVFFDVDADRPLIRKWFAIIGAALKTGMTPWTNKETAHKALKVATGVVDPTPLPSGELFPLEMSIKELDDRELEETIDGPTGLLALLYRMTGIHFDDQHPEMRAEDMRPFAPDYPEQESPTGAPSDGEASPGPSPAGDEAGADAGGLADPSAGAQSDPPATIASTQESSSPASTGEAVQAEQASDAGASTQTQSPDAPALTDEQKAWLKQAAIMMCAAAWPGEDPDVLQGTVKGIIEHPDYEALRGTEAAKRAQAIFKHLVKVCRIEIEEINYSFIAQQYDGKTDELKRIDEGTKRQFK